MNLDKDDKEYMDLKIQYWINMVMPAILATHSQDCPTALKLRDSKMFIAGITFTCSAIATLIGLGITWLSRRW